MNLIVGVGALGVSMFIFYRVITYDSHPPGRWGVTQRAKVVSRFSLMMQALLALLFSVTVSFESIPFGLRLLLGFLGFVGVFVGTIYDNHFRQEDLDDARRRKASSGWPPLSVGVARLLSEIILVTSIIGAGVGYVLGGLVSFGSISPPAMERLPTVWT